MARKLSLEQARRFFKNLASALLPGSRFALWVESTSKKNKFTAVLLPKDYDPHKFLSTIKPKFLVVRPSFDELLSINGLNSFIEKSSPQLMLRPGQAVELEWIVNTFNCNPDELYQLILRSIRSKVNAALKRHYIDVPAEFMVQAIDKFSRDVYCQTSNLKTIDELYVWADLHAN